MWIEICKIIEAEAEELHSLKLNSLILQEFIVEHINGNSKAGWKAAMSPRFSNYTVGQFKHLLGNVSLSVNDLLSCCGFLCGSGCDGGYPLNAWQYLVRQGEECDPYFDQIGCSHPGCETAYPTPMCVRNCANGNQLWSQSKHYSDNSYRVNSDPYDIMTEVFKNGPVEVSFTVYEVSESLMRLLYLIVLQLI
ncbi:hypothetical protein K1719_037477 [Acacia pycnantha]|nr:hypothetical protein K1719_037477 [Acacia pycnantha]